MTAGRIAAESAAARPQRRFRAPPAAVEARRHPEQRLLLWQLRGEGEVDVAGTRLVLSEGRALWIPEGLRHSVRIAADSVLLPLFFAAPARSDGLGAVRIVAVSPELRTLLLAHWQRTHTILETIDPSEQILSAIASSPAVPAEPPLPVTAAALRVARALLLDPADDRGVEELAAAAHVSYSTVKRAFLAETGMSPHRWRIALRMEIAASLLPESRSIPAVSASVGYRNTSAFGRQFKRHFGVAPSAFGARARARSRAGAPGHRQDPPPASGPLEAQLPATGLPERYEADRHLLLWQARGDSELRLAGVVRTLVAGEAAWIPAGTPHALTVRADSVLLPLAFRAWGPAAAEAGAGPSAAAPAQPVTVSVDRELRTLFLARLQWEHTLLRGGVDFAPEILAAIAELPGAVAVAAAPPGSEEGRRQRQRRNRMAAAGRLLRTQAKVSAVSSRVGYESVSSFGRAFKRHFGMTPSEYIDRYNRGR